MRSNRHRAQRQAGSMGPSRSPNKRPFLERAAAKLNFMNVIAYVILGTALALSFWRNL